MIGYILVHLNSGFCMMSSILLYFWSSFFAGSAFYFPDCSFQTLGIFLYPFISLGSFFGFTLVCYFPSYVSHWKHIMANSDLFHPTSGKEGITVFFIFNCLILLPVLFCMLPDLQVPFGERNLLFKCTVGGTYDLRERFKPSATYFPFGMPKSLLSFP